MKKNIALLISGILTVNTLQFAVAQSESPAFPQSPDETVVHERELTPAERADQIAKDLQEVYRRGKVTVTGVKEVVKAELTLEQAQRIAKDKLPETVAEIQQGVAQLNALINKIRELRETAKGDIFLEASMYLQLLLTSATTLMTDLHISKTQLSRVQFSATVALMWANIINTRVVKGSKLEKIGPETMKESLRLLAADLANNGFSQSEIGKASSFVSGPSKSLDTEKGNLLTENLSGFGDLGPKAQFSIAALATVYAVMLYIPVTEKFAQGRIKFFTELVAKSRETVKGAAQKHSIKARATGGITVGGVDVGDMLVGMNTKKGLALLNETEANLVQASNELQASLLKK